LTPSVTDSAVYTALGNFLATVLPAGTVVQQGQLNRVAEPAAVNFVVMLVTLQRRLDTDIATSADCAYEGSIAGTVMTVTEVLLGIIPAGGPLFGTGVAANSTVVAQLTGPPGGAGTYTVAPSQTLAGPVLLASGQEVLEQSMELTVQLDVHGPASGDNAKVITTALRSEYGVDQFPAGVVPLYTADPRQVPFLNDQKQYETRWVIDAYLQIKPTIAVPQQYADQVTPAVISVDATYPP